MRTKNTMKEWFAVARRVDAMIENYGIKLDWTECKIQTMQADEFKRMAEAVKKNISIPQYMKGVKELWG